MQAIAEHFGIGRMPPPGSDGLPLNKEDAEDRDGLLLVGSNGLIMELRW
jgi:hypothetical protein